MFMNGAGIGMVGHIITLLLPTIQAGLRAGHTVFCAAVLGSITAIAAGLHFAPSLLLLIRRIMLAFEFVELQIDKLKLSN